MLTGGSFDEAHFGYFANMYIQNRFFVDVHPPLGKMILATVGHMNGYNGSFDFASTTKMTYTDNVPFVAMRLVSAICGTAIPILAYCIMKQLGCQQTACMLAAVMLTIGESSLSSARTELLIRLRFRFRNHVPRYHA